MLILGFLTAFILVMLYLCFARPTKPRNPYLDNIRTPHRFDHFNFRNRRERRIAIRMILKEEKLRRAPYMSASELVQYWADCRTLLLGEVMKMRKEA